jgi:hypothetical protein
MSTFKSPILRRFSLVFIKTDYPDKVRSKNVKISVIYQYMVIYFILATIPLSVLSVFMFCSQKARFYGV